MKDVPVVTQWDTMVHAARLHFPGEVLEEAIQTDSPELVAQVIPPDHPLHRNLRLFLDSYGVNWRRVQLAS